MTHRSGQIPASSQAPAPPWRPLADSGRGYLSVYLSDDLARYPVRAVTLRGDNKSDPNIETLTYGLFSTCEPQMRNRIVQDGAATVFFVTKHGRKPRAIVGYYQVGWWAEGARGARNRDFALAARHARFIEPVPATSLPGPLEAICAAWYRTCRPVTSEVTAELRAIIDNRADRIDAYLRELRRLEQFARARTGYAYPSWGRENGFTWDDAPAYYHSPSAMPAEAPNSSPTRLWRCTACQRVIPNRALLKQCPACKAMVTLTPVLNDALEDHVATPRFRQLPARRPDEGQGPEPDDLQQEPRRRLRRPTPPRSRRQHRP